MPTDEKNYTVFNVGPYSQFDVEGESWAKGKLMLGKSLDLTGCKMSLTSIQVGEHVPYVHHHKKNEEVYIVVRGNGMFYVDGQEFPIQEGSMVRVAPEGKRTLKAGDEKLVYLCIQAEVESLARTIDKDGDITKGKASWM